jgi:hypothetical protein
MGSSRAEESQGLLYFTYCFVYSEFRNCTSSVGTRFLLTLTLIPPLNRSPGAAHYRYFRFSKLNALPSTDGWIRGRLRSILRKRTKRKGKGRGPDHYRWRNRFLDEAGLFNLTAARFAGR